MSTTTKLELMTHLDAARALGIQPKRFRRWVECGELPEPHSIVLHTWFYPVATIEYFLERGVWPDGTRFRPGVGRGRGAR